MKKTILSIGILLSTLLQAQTDVRLSINHLFNSAPVQFNTTLTNSSQEEFEITRLEYYISGITLTHDGGQITEASEAFVLVNAEEGTNVLLGNFPITNLESIEFGVGVTSDVNHGDPSLYGPYHALSPKIPSMHWGWSSGYRFVALEGNSGMNLGTLFQFHALGDDNFLKQNISTAGITNGTTLTVVLDADYLSALNTISVYDGPVKHGENYPECIQLLDNFKTSVFSVSTSDVVSIEENENEKLTVYPNPVSNELMVELTNSTEQTDVTYTIQDQLGRTIVKSNHVNGQPISVSNLSNGIYFVELHSSASSIAKQSFIVNK